MKNEFYESALAAAQQSPEAFLREFEKKDADANLKKYYPDLNFYGESLINAIIIRVPDSQLPAILAILVKKGVDLENRGLCDDTPLVLATACCKKNAVNFLVNHKVSINTRSKQPPLCSLMLISDRDGDQSAVCEIAEILMKHGADVNIRNEFLETPLMLAVKYRSFDVVKYLLSKGADLFLKYNYYEAEYKTALGMAYEVYMSVKHSEEPHFRVKDAKRGLDLLVQAAADYLYLHGRKEDNEELFITRAMQDLVGTFSNGYPESSNSDALSQYLEDNIKPAALAARIRAEKKHAFCMGSELSTTQREQKDSIPPVYGFFQHDGRKDLTKEIFSYLHEDRKKRIK